MKNFLQRIITGALFLAVMIGSVWYSSVSFAVVMAIASLFCLWEFLRMARKFSQPAVIMTMIAAVLLLLIALTVRLLPLSQAYLGLAFVLPLLVIVPEVFRKTDQPFINICISLGGILYTVVPFIFLVNIGFATGWYEFRIILLYFIVIWVNDSFAYLTGRLIGKHKLAPSISAGKTIEGTIGGIVFAVVACVLLQNWFFPESSWGPLVTYKPLTLPQWIGFAVLTSSLAVISDLSESRLKRMADQKDSGNLLPGHGGFLDRFDSVLLTAPVIFAYLFLIQ
jgi:phosphatidate cytidylyltransferase